MRLYRITVDEHAAGGVNLTYYVGTQAEAAKFRKELISDLGYKRADIDTEELDVPTDKTGLLAFLNSLEANR